MGKTLFWKHLSHQNHSSLIFSRIPCANSSPQVDLFNKNKEQPKFFLLQFKVTRWSQKSSLENIPRRYILQFSKLQGDILKRKKSKLPFIPFQSQFCYFEILQRSDGKVLNKIKKYKEYKKTVLSLHQNQLNFAIFKSANSMSQACKVVFLNKNFLPCIILRRLEGIRMYCSGVLQLLFWYFGFQS